MDKSMSFPRYYNILGVDVKASPDEIKSAYHKLVKEYHPDVNKNKKQATEKLKQINEAYSVLSNLAKRAEYDYMGRVKNEENNLPNKTTQKTRNPAKTKKNFRVFVLNKLILLCFLFIYVCFIYIHSDKNDMLNIIKTSDNIIKSIKQTGMKINEFYQNKIWIYFTEKNYTFLLKNLPDSFNFTGIYDENKYSLLQKAQDPVMAKILLDKGLDVNYRAPDGNTALSLAVEKNNLSLAELLLQEGADAKQVYGKNKYTLLMLTDNPQIANLLLKHKVHINYVAKDGNTALFLAVKKNNLPLAELLLQQGANIMQTYGKNKYNLLMLTDNLQMVKLLLKHNALINYIAKDGMSPLHLAAQKHNDKLLEVLHKYEHKSQFNWKSQVK